MSESTADTHASFLQLKEHLQTVIVGQSELLDRLMIGLLTAGHILLEGPPGLAKTTAVNALASGVQASAQRIQFTPDLMPGDLTGSEIYDAGKGEFKFVPGPLFHDIILADEINRAPPKVQSALLEAMQEHQVTVNGVTRKLPELFLVMATQNPLEQTGTYPLPEAQLDRFLLHVVIGYPTADEEWQILQRDKRLHLDPAGEPSSVISPELVKRAREQVNRIHIEESVERYIIEIVTATRDVGRLIPEWQGYIDIGASPRATLAAVRAAGAHAYLQGRDFITPDDVVEILPDVLRHRLILSYSAETQQISKDMIVRKIIETVNMP
jgi:MoxR-like ATPase